MVVAGEYTVQYATNFDERPNAWRLLELDPDAEAALKAGEGLYIKGATKAEHDGAAVICTTKRTWALRFAEDSNLFLFGEVAAGEAAPEMTLRGSVTGTVECLPVQPRLRKVRRLLEEKNAYTTDITLTARDEQEPLGIAELEFAAASSAAELSSYLEKGAVKIDGKWRSLSSEIACTAQDKVLEALAMDGMLGSEFTTDAACAVVAKAFDETEAGMPLSVGEGSSATRREVVEWALLMLTKPGESDGALRLDEKKVVRAKAVAVLHEQRESGKNQDGLLDVDAFNKHVLEQLSSEVAPPEDPPLKLVRDCTFVKNGKVCYLDTDSLAENAVERIRDLFKIKAQWSEDELSGLLEPVLPPGTALATVLARHARMIFLGPRDKEERFFVCRAPGL
jgi:hypothetical protein